jgi:hypothetical protein
MRQTKVNPEVLIAFVIGLLAGGTGVGLITFRQIQGEHRYAGQMANAARRAEASSRGELIRAHEMTASAINEAHNSAAIAKQTREEAQRQAELARSHGGSVLTK